MIFRYNTSMKILVVDDMSQWRNYHESALNQVLDKITFELEVASSATDAMQIIQQNLSKPFDLIISDLQMETDFDPEYAGEWLVRNVQMLKQYANVPKIIVSAAYNIRYIAENLGVDYLSKPLLINNPLIYELKIQEVLGLNS